VVFTHAVSARSDLEKARRIVVKIGSRTLTGDPELPSKLATQIAELGQPKRGFVIVTSGAIALGVARLGYRQKPKEVALLQAAAAAGQSVLMRRYDEAFGARGITPAQVLLTHADLADRDRLNNARNALGALLDAGAVPIINENDTVATEEIRFGDNDQLAAMVVPLVSADLLVLLTDVEGVLDARGKRIAVMTDSAEMGSVAEARERVGSGGMSSKVDAARKASRSGAAVVIAPAGHPRVLCDLLSGADVGTLFPCLGPPLKARKHWIAFTLRPRGTLILDSGAARAVRAGKSSLLAVGIAGVRGEFSPGDAVRLVSQGEEELARGLTRLSTAEVARTAGKKAPKVVSAEDSELIVVHKDDLVLTR
jgi:glutamate 5-kinase